MIYKNMSYKDYDQIGALRYSDLKHLAKSKAHWEYYKNNPIKETASIQFGKLLHAMIEQNSDRPKGYDVMPKFDKRTKQGKKDYNEFIENKVNDIEYIDADIFLNADMAFISIKNQHFYEMFLNENVIHELTATTEEYKSRLDMAIYNNDDKIYDHLEIKTTKSDIKNERQLYYDVINNGYDKQMLFHQFVMAKNGHDVKESYIWFIENKPPYFNTIYKVTDMLDCLHGSFTHWLDRALNNYKHGDSIMFDYTMAPELNNLY